ncbi:Trans-1,2-dihydrobenzene-1,2-diol dehydrogenase [Hondaea fermentalgiana]|uniref:Trans-1,2-dihydrobenzene-1,2-diol dehydrogenase n=1 Tax=Hondaea fermentalgiana TaxID=2315210 RepID=A0A2R5GS17_9STRA|nr:Trans-1,2-dihydrobenzene-1,2-diol dehydrogenase [Hondaea fermentalgiana]|eukprot:GBG33672.1 Trans-1,2-dihydrobenzene-1,2-diol dehydrogenase [Hondaea fermentalgiana]
MAAKKEDALQAAHALAKKVGGDTYTKENPMRLGVISTANIARKVISGVQALDTVKVTVVSSRNLEKAQQFAKDVGVDKAYGSYEEVLADPEIDAVYVPLPTSMHTEWVCKAAKAGKHVLCEKPCALSGAQLLEMLLVCKENKVHFMDNVMFMHHDRLRMMRERIDEGFLGKHGATNVFSTLTFRSSGDFGEDFYSSNIRTNPDLDALGAVGDLGWYNMRMALFAFAWRTPATAQGRMLISHNKVPIEISGVLTWDPEEGEEDVAGITLQRSTVFHGSFLHSNQQRVQITGADGMIALDDFVNANSTKSASFFEESKHETIMTEDGPEAKSERNVVETGYCRQEAEAVANFACQIAALKQGQSIDFWPRIALLTQLCCDALLESAEKNGATVKIDPEGLLARFDAA